MVAPSPDLSPNDAKVLSTLFNQESGSPTPMKVTPHPPQSLPHISDTLLPSLQAAERSAILPLNIPHPSRRDVDAAVEALSELISQHPCYASAYLNRAQVTRLKFADGILTSKPEEAHTIKELFADLARAIQLASPACSEETLSPLQMRLLAAAHTHRGYLLLKVANASGDVKLEGVPCYGRANDKDDLEEMASRDFFLGGRYGNKIAKELALRTNPYAKMCGAIVKRAMREEVADIIRIDV